MQDAAQQVAPRPGKATRASQVVERLREAILSGELGPGSKVNLDAMRAKLGVSLSPLREAIARLAPAGLVVFEDQRGYRIAPVSAENLVEIVHLRAELESLALGHACAKGGIGWESEVLRALHRLGRTDCDPSRPETRTGWEAAHRAFHAALVAGSELPMLIGFCTNLADLSERYHRLFGPGRPDPDEASEHAAVAEAAVARDADRARRLLRRHIETAGSRLAARLSKELGASGAPEVRIPGRG